MPGCNSINFSAISANPSADAFHLGASRIEQICENVNALDNMQLSEEELSQIQAILSNYEEKESKV